MTTTETETAISSPTRTIKRKRGAPQSNENSLTHGIYRWSAAGKLPRNMKYLRGELRRLRANLEAAVVAEFNRPPTIYEHSLITDVQRHEGVARLCETWLAREANALSATDRVAFARQIQHATNEKTRSIKALGLDVSRFSNRGPASDSLFAHVIEVKSDEAADAADATITAMPPAPAPPAVAAAGTQADDQATPPVDAAERLPEAMPTGAADEATDGWL